VGISFRTSNKLYWDPAKKYHSAFKKEKWRGVKEKKRNKKKTKGEKNNAMTGGKRYSTIQGGSSMGEDAQSDTFRIGALKENGGGKKLPGKRIQR